MLHSVRENNRAPKLSQAVLLVLLIVQAVILIACGGGSSSPSNQFGTTSGSAQVQVNIGDSPADRIVACAVTINSLSLTSSSGTSVTMSSSPMSIELTHLMATMQPLSMKSVPRGTYTGASMSIGSAMITYLDPVSHSMVQKSVAGPMPVTINFSPAMTVGSGPMVLNLDMNMGMSFSFDGSGNMKFSPTFLSSTGMLGAGNPLDPQHGGMQHLVGSVGNMSGAGFSMSTMMGALTMSFKTDSSTVFEGGLSGMGMMSNGMIVMVDAVMQSDGSMLAKTIERLMDSGGMMAEGLLNNVTGNPATQLTVVAQGGMGSGMMSSVLANTMTVNVGSGTVYKIDSDMIDESGLPFTPVFDSSHIYAGQRVEVESGSGMMGMGGGMMGGTVNASEVDLEQQGFTGTVSNYLSSGSSATFTLTLASDSAFATLTGATAIAVYQQGATELFGASTVSNGIAMHARGLLFKDAGTWKLVASRMVIP